jgi:hypothetical protein
VTCQRLCSNSFDETAKKRIDGISDAHWPQCDVLDNAVAEKIQAAQAALHSVLRTLLSPLASHASLPR